LRNRFNDLAAHFATGSVNNDWDRRLIRHNLRISLGTKRILD
jgi:hypothetical protein